MAPRLNLTPTQRVGLTDGRPRGELARCRDEPQLLAIFGDRRGARAAPQPSHFDVAQRDIKLYLLIHFLPARPRSRVGRSEQRPTNDRYLSIFDDAPFEGPRRSLPSPFSLPPSRSLRCDRSLVTCQIRGGEQFCQDRIFHPSIYPVVQCSGRGIAIKAAFNPQSSLTHTLACTLQK